MLDSDRWLVRRTLAGNRDAFGRLYDKYSPRVFHFLRRLTASDTEAEDLAQETFVAAYEALSQWRGEGAFSTWLCGIAFRKYSHQFRRAVLTDELTEAVEDMLPTLDTSSDPLARCTRREREQAVEKAIAALPRLSREVFILVRVEEMSYKDAAALLGVPIGTVQSRLFRATQELQAALRHLFYDATPDVKSCDPAHPKKGANHAMR